MKLEIIIPPGWERVTKGKLEKNDRCDNMKEMRWDRVTAFEIKAEDWPYYLCIRKVKVKNGKQ